MMQRFFQHVLAVAWKEALQLRRDPRLLPILFIAPVVQMLFLGYGATFDLKDLPVALWDRDRTAESRSYVRAFTHSGYFSVRYDVQGYDRASDLLVKGEAKAILVVPPDFGRRLKKGRPADVQAIVDGTDSNTAQIGLHYLHAISEAYASGLAGPENTALAGPAVEGRLRFWYNPELESKNFMVPGVMAMILLVMTTMMTALGIVKERELGTVEQLTVTPLRPSEIMLGKLLPFAAIGAVDVVVVLLVAVLWFGVPVRGSIPLLFVLTAVYLLSTLGLGLLFSTLSRTQNQAQLTTFFAMFPMMVFSGMVFPISNMPEVFQALSYLSPVRYYLAIIRNLFLKGSGMEVLWPEVLPLALLGGCIFLFSVWRFRRALVH